jgi:hypothetical protein
LVVYGNRTKLVVKIEIKKRMSCKGFWLLFRFVSLKNFSGIVAINDDEIEKIPKHSYKWTFMNSHEFCL